MIRTMTVVCALALSATAAFASTNNTTTGAQPAATTPTTKMQLASTMRSDPMDANARMKKRKMKHHMMKESGPMNDGQKSSMGDGMSGGMKKGAMGGGMSK